MKIRTASPALISVFALSWLGTLGAQIQRLDLPEMIGDCDHAVFAKIVACQTEEIVHPVEGPEVMTTLTLAGESLYDASSVTVDVSFLGGFEPGQVNSEAPVADDCRVGSQIVAFYTWTDRLLPEVGANALHAAHGGIYRTVEGPGGTVILGRGDGFAVKNNVKVGDLRKAIATVRQAQQRKED